MMVICRGEEDYVEQDEDGYDHFQGEHAQLVELSDHELVQFAGRFQFFGTRVS